ncbi:hypothetical protein EMIHUDRAFT_439406 [Emiliania huxleyi CCMP1516]|uniref:Exostosin GT47 domain-containing protein n=2 Tax=Emiliania huxleyi TaxID=2903 RepID=A0A0D3HXQ3_EMIH1|nr:hypothetical protein EMIHUDRAFT_439406 [Emiliania huxleyi CCMP1516]EOD03788.1 hypothetical protein EMIHUDRAFT_439406 [Emiliania huxleyi CCMP1516]|eukprot:XP_005756217.1 hypothetical protein EMIHUDRAFT_439406 [Emiliania huxleyi CCMP1516]
MCRVLVRSLWFWGVLLRPTRGVPLTKWGARAKAAPKPQRLQAEMRKRQNNVSFGECVLQIYNHIQTPEERSSGYPRRGHDAGVPRDGPFKYNFRNWTPKPVQKDELFSVVQTNPPPCSLAAHCDWVVGSRYEHWGQLPGFTVWGDPYTVPGTIFVNTDELETFSESLLHCIPRRHGVVLITGDHDKTTPLQTDVRYPRVLRSSTWANWLKDERILHIYVEHLDAAVASSKVSPIPTGMNPRDAGGMSLASAPRKVRIQSLPLRVVEIGRQRGGRQFHERQFVRDLCNSTPWPWCDVASTTNEGFSAVVQKYPFLLCVHGGGIDPNPKLFSAILSGAIPIMRDFPGATMYDGWPVVRVSNWTDINISMLAQWRKLHAPAFEDEWLRNQTLERLTMRHWWSKIHPPPGPRRHQSI